MPQHLPGGDDDHDDLAALDFYGSDPVSTDDHSGGYDFYAGEEVSHDDTGVDALHSYSAAPDPVDDGGDLDTLHSLTEDEDEEEEIELYTVTNPPGSVAVSALIDGRIHKIELTGGAGRMTESQLAEEIVVIAELARRKARAGQQATILASMEESEDIGAEERAALKNFLGSSLQLPTEEEAAAAEAEVFAERYADDDENE